MSEDVTDFKTELKLIAARQEQTNSTQQENSASIKSMEFSISKLANTVTEFVVESRHLRKDVSDLTHAIHGKGEIADRLAYVETKKAVEIGRKDLVIRWLAPIGTFLSGVAMILAGIILNKGP